MNSRLLAVAVSLLLANAPVLAHGGHDHDAVVPGRDTTGATLSIAPAAADAVAAVERFSAALGSGDLTTVAALLDAKVVVLESGEAQRSREAYMSDHAKEDAAFLKTAKVTLKQRTAQASGDLAWVASESSIHAKKGDSLLAIDSTETMVLRKDASGWKIVHIHWSSRRAKADP